MNTTPFYIVTYYGCGNSANELLTPESRLFVNFNDAYLHFLNISPELKGGYKTSQYVNIHFDKDDTNIKRGEYTVIESRVQEHGYYEDESNCTRSPYGAVIIRCAIG